MGLSAAGASLPMDDESVAGSPHLCELASYHVLLAALGVAIILAFWLPRFVSAREPARTADLAQLLPVDRVGIHGVRASGTIEIRLCSPDSPRLPPTPPDSPKAPMFHLLAVWTACSSVTAEPAEPLGAIVTDVVAGLDRAVALAPTDNGAALLAWSMAHDRFEADLEPRLRSNQDAADVVRVEYAFAQVRGALGTDEALSAVTALAERLDRLVPGTVSASATGGSRSVAAR